MWVAIILDCLLSFVAVCNFLENRTPSNPALSSEDVDSREIYQVVISESLLLEMVEKSKAKLPNETGGVIVGKYDRHKVFIKAISDQGPNALATPVSFLRDGVYSQQFLIDKTMEDPSVLYVGEWHSHPSEQESPSQKDIKGMIEIANSPDYRTSHPILVVVAIAEEKTLITFTCIAPDGRVWFVDICDREKCLFPGGKK